MSNYDESFEELYVIYTLAMRKLEAELKALGLKVSEIKAVKENARTVEIN